MKKEPKVNVIIPTYNRAHLIGRAIQSVLNQTYQGFELIVVDDGSTDNTDEIIKEFQQKDNRIIYLKHEKNKGGSAARNTGIKASKGEYIAFLDSDDEWLSEKLRKQLTFIENSHYGFIYCNMIINDKTRNSKSNITKKFEDNIFLDLLKAGNGICTSSLLIKRHLLEKIKGFDEDLPSFQDYDLLLRLAQNEKCGFLNEILLIYNLHKGSISKTFRGKMIGKEKVLSKYYDYYMSLNLKNYYAKHCYRVASYALLCGNKEIASKYLKKSISNDPFYLKSYIVYLIVNIFGIDVFFKISKIKNRIYKYV